MKSSFLDKLIGKIDRIDPQSLQSFVLKLSREKGFLETLFNTIQEGIIVTTADGQISYLNAAAAEMLALDATESVGQPISRYLRDLNWEKIFSADKKEWRKVLAHEIEVYYPRQRFLSFYIVPLMGEANEAISGIAVILRDVTEMRRHAEDTLESEKISAVTMLAAGVAHEIGNPLNSLTIHLQLMDRELKSLPGASADRLRSDLRVAREEVARLDRIVNQFLRAVRPTKPDLQRASVNDIVSESIALMRQEIESRDILLELELAADLPRCLVDREQLRQVCFNLVKNALQAMRPGGILRVVTETGETHICISFIDTGHGISPEQIGRIFEAYYTSKQEGTGLGLMIVQRIVREHGGAIDVESGVGRGTTVRIKLPIHEKRTRLLHAGTAA